MVSTLPGSHGYRNAWRLSRFLVMWQLVARVVLGLWNEPCPVSENHIDNRVPWFWLPSGLLGVTDPDEGGRVPLPHGARLRPSLLPSHRRRFCAFFHFFSFAPFFSRPLPFFTTRQNRAPALYHFSGSNTPWVQGPATDFTPKRSNTPWAHGPATCSAFPH